MWRFFVCVLLLSVLPSAARPTAHLVRPDGTGDFPTIQDAVGTAATGDTVLLADGTFVGDGIRDVDFLGTVIVVRCQSGNATSCVIACEGGSSRPNLGVMSW